MSTFMRRLFLTLGLFFTAVCTPSAVAQQWSGTAGVTLSGGSQTNLYLDPVLSTWNPAIEPEFGAVTPRLGLTFNTSRVRLDLTGRSRFQPRRTENPQLSQGNIRLRLTLTPDWSLGAVAGGQRYRFTTRRENFTTRRDSWWVLPSLRWTPTSETMITFQGGVTQRFERSFERSFGTDRQTSRLVSVHLTHWMTDRVKGGVRTYFSNGQTSTTDADFGSIGGSVELTYWPTSSVSLTGTAAFEQPSFDFLPRDGTQQFETARDQIGRTGLEVEWDVRPSITVFGRAKGLYADLETNGTNTDVHVSGGVRFQVQGALGGDSDPPPQRQVCHNTENGVKLRVPYEGSGTLHVTGDFNGWSLPGVPLEQEEKDIWTATLDLSPGRYQYRFRTVKDGNERWYDLPPYARTAEDPFGGTNGICIVH